jgi:acetyl esterase
MPVHPQVQVVLDLVNAVDAGPLSDDRLQEIRDGFALLWANGAGDPQAVAHVEDRTVPADHGDIPIRIYRPDDRRDRPVVVFFHGGGWTIGSIDAYDPIVRMLTNAAQCVFVSVDYRLAPEDPYPAAVEDCWTALQWVAAHPADVGGDTSRLAVAGDSAGGNLSAVCALLARDAGTPKLATQILMYPVTDYGFGTESYRENASGYFLEDAEMHWFFDCYTRGGADPTHWHIAPLRATSHEGVAPALVITAEYDPLRDEGEAYGRALAAAGVSTTVTRYDGMIHGFMCLPSAIDDAKVALDEVVHALDAAFAPGTLA